MGVLAVLVVNMYALEVGLLTLAVVTSALYPPPQYAHPQPYQPMPPPPQYPPQPPPQQPYYPQPGPYPQQPGGYYPQPAYGAQPGFDPLTFMALSGMTGGSSSLDPMALLAMGGGGLGLGGAGPFDPTSVIRLSGGLPGLGGSSAGLSPNLLGDPELLSIAGGMGGLGGPYNGAGIDPMALLTMNANGLGGGIDGLLSAGLGGDGAGLFASILGGEGMRDPSQGITNLLAANLIADGDDVDEDGEPDHLVETRNKIDDYLAKQWLLGKRKLTVSVNYGNMPLEYQYLNQYHGFPNPLAGTPLGPRFGLPGPAPLPPKPVAPVYRPPPPPSGYRPPAHGYGGPPPRPPPSYLPPRPKPHQEPEPRPYPKPEPHSEPTH